MQSIRLNPQNYYSRSYLTLKYFNVMSKPTPIRYLFGSAYDALVAKFVKDNHASKSLTNNAV